MVGLPWFMPEDAVTYLKISNMIFREVAIMPQQTPELFYVFRDGYDYRSYLETKSHFDRVEIAVDSGIRSLVASSEAMAEQEIQAINQLGEDIRSGFEELVVSLDSIERSIDKLKSVCENGFAHISLRLHSINESIDELIRIAKTPDQTWAFEQYSIAKDAFSRDLVEEAMDYVNRAINGHGQRSGYRLEHRFYMLRGLIRLGNYRNFSPDIMDLDAATADFLLAAKYAEHVDLEDRARSLGLAGWASYCNGKMRDAEKYLRKSIEVNECDDQSRFELSKVLFHQDKIEEALKHFSIVLRRDWKYGLRAGSDDDFLKHRAAVEAAIKEYLDELRNAMTNWVREYDQLGISRKQPILDRHGFSLDQGAKRQLERVKSTYLSAPVSDLKAMTEIVSNCLESLRQGLKKAKDQLRAEANYLRKRKVLTSDDIAEIFAKIYIFAFLFGAGAYLLMVISGFQEDFLSGIVVAVVGIAAFFVFALIGFIIGAILIGGISVWNKTVQKDRKLAELERDAARL